MVLQFSRSVMSDSFRPHESQHARPPCPSPTPGVHSDSCPSSQWCHPAISSSVVLFSFCPQTLPTSVFSLFQILESLAPKNRCFWTVVLEKTLESPLDCKEIQPVHSEGDQLWDFFGRSDAKAETPVLWPPHVKSWLIGKDSDAGRDWGQEEKGTTEDEMAGWHHRLDGHELEWTPGVGDGQGGLACCNSWGRKESDMTEWLNWTELNTIYRTCLWFRKER